MTDPELPRAVRVRFSLEAEGYLQGRVNRHWRATRGGEPVVVRRWAGSEAGMRYEVAVLDSLAADGWPVAVVLSEPLFIDGAWWTASPFLAGEPRDRAEPGEQRSRGRLLAALHGTTAGFTGIGRRPGWRTAAEILADPGLDVLFRSRERDLPDEMRLVRWHLDRARDRFDPDAFAALPTIVVHGDFTPWNLLFERGRLSGLLDLELARRDVRVADFALSWRGKHDDVIRGYDRVAPLSDAEWELLTPVWWAQLIEGAAEFVGMSDERWDDGWIASKLRERSPLMGRDAVPYPW